MYQWVIVLIMLAVAAFFLWRPDQRLVRGTLRRRLHLRGSGGDDHHELDRLVELAGDAVMADLHTLRARPIIPGYLWLRVPPELEQLVTAHFGALAQEIETTVRDRVTAAGYPWSSDQSVKVQPRVFRGELAVTARHQPTDQPFQLVTAPRTTGVELVSPDATASAAPFDQPDDEAVPRTPDPSTTPWASLVVDGVETNRVRMDPRVTRVGRRPKSDLVLPLRGGLSADHLVMTPAGPTSIEVTDTSRYGTSVQVGDVWTPMVPKQPVVLELPVRLSLGQGYDVLVTIEQTIA